jgi:hypothetical protein
MYSLFRKKEFILSLQDSGATPCAWVDFGKHKQAPIQKPHPTILVALRDQKCFSRQMDSFNEICCVHFTSSWPVTSSGPAVPNWPTRPTILGHLLPCANCLLAPSDCHAVTPLCCATGSPSHKLSCVAHRRLPFLSHNRRLRLPFASSKWVPHCVPKTSP